MCLNINREVIERSCIWKYLSLQRKYYVLPRDNTVEEVSVWNNQLWLNDYGARIKAFPKNKAFNRKATDGAPGPTQNASSPWKRPEGASFIFPLICCPFVSI